MSIIEKKINQQPAMPSHIHNSKDMWKSLHISVCEAIGEMTGQEWVADKLDYKISSLKPLLKDLTNPGLYFSFASPETPTCVLMNLDKNLAPLVTSRSLRSEPNSNIGLLDILLLRPIAKTVLGGLIDLFGSYDGHVLDITSQNLSPLNLEMPRGDEEWVSVTLSIKASDDDEVSNQPIKKTKSNKKNTANQQKENTRISVQLIIPLDLLESVQVNIGGNVDHPVIDPENPWTQHMRHALDGAVVPVRAVVETCRMTVAECMRLEIDQVIDLPGISLQAISLETELGKGNVNFATGALGIYKSQRAMKLIDDINIDFIPEPDLI